MGIFHEFFPVTKALIPEQAESLKKAELCELGGGDIGFEDFDAERSKKSHKQGLTEKVREIVDGTHQQINQSKIIEQQLSRVHHLIEKFDKINFIIEPGYETYVVDPQRFRVAACESILSMDSRTCKEKAVNSRTSKPAPKPASRVDPKNYQKLPISSKKLTKTASMPILSSSKSNSSPTSTFAIPKKSSHCSQKLPSLEVQQILKAAKDKRVSKRSEIKIPVVELKL